jgi:predicted ATPase/DNA-binding SARP family transcriptional activator
MLATLSLVPGRIVSTEDLIDELWGDEPPARARDSLQMHVSRLRKALTEAGADGRRLMRRAGGYVVDLPPGARDVDRWQQALARARQLRDAGEPAAARAELEAALGLWRGQAIAGVGVNALLSAHRGRLEEERLRAVVEGIELDLELGRHDELLGQLEELVIAHPFSERLVELQMLALYRSGRQADALAAFRAAHSRFVEELGIEPSRRLSELQEDVLRHTAALSLPPADERLATGSHGAAPRAARPLPVPPNRTIGRERDLHLIAERLRADSVRLLTVTGTGGVGKSRVALEIARAVAVDFPDGAFFVPLAALRSRDELPAAVLDAVKLATQPGESPADALVRALAPKRLLLVLDNFEHLLTGAPFVAELLAACPGLTVLVTSREPLSLQGEERYLLAGLALPAPGAPVDVRTLGAVDAIALFCERARARDAVFVLDDANAPVVAHICRRVDGLPLAVELTAARCDLLSPAEIAARLDDALSAPGAGARDADLRQQTLRATIDWSHDLLDDDIKPYFARFAVFAGGATVEAAERVTGAGLASLEALVAKNLLVRRRHAPASTRLHMLETIQSYARERLADRDEEDAVRARHYEHFLSLARRHGSDRALFGPGGYEHTAVLDADVDNLHAALSWALRRPSAAPALELSVALAQYWWRASRFAEGARFIEQALNAPGANAHAALRVRALCAEALLLWPMWRQADVAAAITEAETLARAIGEPLLLSLALQVRARIVAAGGPVDVVAAPIAAEALALAEVAGDRWALGMAAYAAVIAATTLDELRRGVERATTLLDETGNSYHLARVLAAAIGGALGFGSGCDAKAYLERATTLARATDDAHSREFLLGNAGYVGLFTGDVDAADRAFREELELTRQTSVTRFAHEALLGLAAVASAHGDNRRAALLAGAADAHREDGPKDELETKLEADFLAPARRRHGAIDWDAAVRDGHALSLENAIEYALPVQPDPRP